MVRHCSQCGSRYHDARTCPKKRTRRNPAGAGFKKGGVFHPNRSWAGYDPARAGEKPKEKPKPVRKPKVGTPEERHAKAVAIAKKRRQDREIDARIDAYDKRQQERIERNRAEIRQKASVNTNPATESQRSYINSLLQMIRQKRGEQAYENMKALKRASTVADASKAIDQLKEALEKSH